MGPTGTSRRLVLSASRRCVSSFSSASSCVRAASHSSLVAILGRLMHLSSVAGQTHRGPYPEETIEQGEIHRSGIGQRTRSVRLASRRTAQERHELVRVELDRLKTILESR